MQEYGQKFPKLNCFPAILDFLAKKNAAWAFLTLRVKNKGGSISCNSVSQEKYFVSR